MTARDETLRLLSGHLRAASCLVDSLLPEAESDEATKCPFCGEVDEERLEDTSTDVARMTCKSCGKSWAPEVTRG